MRFFSTRSPRRASFRLLAIALLSLLAERGDALPRESQWWLYDTWAIDSPSESPPQASDPGWTSLRLPDIWKDRQPAGTNVWYRFRIPAAGAPSEPHAVYLWRFNMNTAAYFNGSFIGDGGRFREPMARNWNRPLLFSIPAGLWRDGENELLVRIASYPGYGYLAPPGFGPERELRPRFERRRFLQNDVNVGIYFITLAVSGFLLAIWVLRRHDTKYLWFVASTLAASVICLNTFVRDVPLPAHAWWWLVHTSIDAWLVCLAVFVHRQLGERHPRREALFFAYAIAASAAYALVDFEDLNQTTVLAHTGSFAIDVYLVVLLGRAWRRSRDRETLALWLAVGAILLIGVNDWLMQTLAVQWMWFYTPHVLQYAAPIVAAGLAWVLCLRFVRALNESESLNRELEDRIALARGELERSFRSIGDLERHRAVAEERERIYGDLHDDIGAKLLTLVHRAEPGFADSLREVLRELRRVVHSIGRSDWVWSELVADWRSEIAERCEAAGVDLVWQIGDGVPARNVDPRAGTHLERILAEAVSNALAHGRPERIDVRVEEIGDTVAFSVIDDGRGRNGTAPSAGRGMHNMRLRVTQLGGTIAWGRNGGQGTVVEWRVPTGAVFVQSARREEGAS